LALLLSLAGPRAETATLLLSGLAISALAGALTTLALALAPSPFAFYDAYAWLMGSLIDRSLAQLAFAALPALLAIGLLLRRTAALDSLALGEEVAQSIGHDIDRVRIEVICLTALGVGACVAICGAIGFVGLVAPLLARLLGVRPHRWLLPAAGLLGTAMLLGADLLARQFLRGPLGGEVPAGLITALIGAPFFLALARRVGTGLRDRSVDITSRPGARRAPYPLVLAGSVVVLTTLIAVGLRFGDLPVTWADLAGTLTGSADPGRAGSSEYMRL
jgi:iron complex transport system permease protein